MHIVRCLSGLLAVAAIAAVLMAWREPDGAATTPAATAFPAPPQPAGPSREPAPPPVHGAPVAGEPSLNVQVERLLATHDPADAYRAYWLVANCAAFNLNGDRIVFDEEMLTQTDFEPGTLPGFRGMTDEEKRHDARSCGNMSERERQSRLDYLAIAARAGVPGAAVTFAIEGPFGDPSALQTRPGDPLVQAWRATAGAQLAQAAESRADVGAIQYLAGEYANGAVLGAKNPLLAYRYDAAWSLIMQDLMGPDNPYAKNLAGNLEQMAGTMQDGSPEQRAAELAAAHRIADLAKARREQARKQAPGR